MAEVKWLGLGDLPKLHIFMVFMQLFTSIAFASLASFRWETLLLSCFICSVARMCIRVCEVWPKSHATDWQGFVQVLGGMLIFFSCNPQLRKNLNISSCPAQNDLKLLGTSNTYWEGTLCFLNFSTVESLSANIVGFVWNFHTWVFFPGIEKKEGEWPKVTSAT